MYCSIVLWLCRKQKQKCYDWFVVSNCRALSQAPQPASTTLKPFSCSLIVDVFHLPAVHLIPLIAGDRIALDGLRSRKVCNVSSNHSWWNCCIFIFFELRPLSQLPRFWFYFFFFSPLLGRSKLFFFSFVSQSFSRFMDRPVSNRINTQHRSPT